MKSHPYRIRDLELVFREYKMDKFHFFIRCAVAELEEILKNV